MLVLELDFLTGRYHATPWDRHVNEGAIEWPPSPWRILRSLIAVWHRKADPVRYPEEKLRELILLLTMELPLFKLPNTSSFHTRHYMPEKVDTTLVFDAFMSVGEGANRQSMLVVWRETDLSPELLGVLDFLLENMGYLGRAESWVSASRRDGWDGTFNCFPVASARELGEPASRLQGRAENVQVLIPLTPTLYRTWSQGFITALKSSWKRVKSEWLPPEDLYEALLVETNDLHKGLWSNPPGAYWETYEIRRSVESTGHRLSEPVLSHAAARYLLTGKIRPKVEQSVEIGNLLRATLMSLGADKPSQAILGRDEDGMPLRKSHSHAFFLPEDADGDGLIDHVVFYSPSPVSEDVQVALTRAGYLFTHGGIGSGKSQRWEIILEAIGTRNVLAAVTPLMQKSRVWVTRTPYFHPWHRKKHGRFGPADQIRHEAELRSMPEVLDVEFLGDSVWSDLTAGVVEARRRRLYKSAFRRVRSENTAGERMPDQFGSFVKITFAEPIEGPVCFGYGCHYGLGLFAPQGEESGAVMHESGGVEIPKSLLME